MATNETKWTPGPWRAVRDRAGAHIRIRDRRDFALATVYGTGGEAENLSFLPQQENADLFSAAPDLYAALVEANAYLAACLTQGTISNDLNAEVCRAMSRADAALAKAEGR